MEKIGHLKPESRKFFKAISKNYTDFEDHHLKILLKACECLDRITEAQEAVKTDGAFYLDKGKPKAHPGLKEEKDNKILFARLMRELNLDYEPPGQVGRPPRLY